MLKNTTENIGGFPYILDYLNIYLPYSIISFITCILGIFGNLGVILGVLLNPNLRQNQTCILILNLAFSDLIISLLVHPSMIAGIMLGKKFFDRNYYLCVFFGSTCLIACSTSVMTMTLLAINRYTCIFHLKSYKKYFSIRNTIKLCLSTWIIGFLVDLPNYIGIGDHVYDLKVLSCHFDRLKIPYTITIAVICVLVPCICIGLLYFFIFFYTHGINKKLNHKRMSVKKNGRTLRAVKIAKSLFASFILFFICWIPVGLLLYFGRHDQLPIWMHATATMAAHINSSLNPILYAISNPIMRQGYRGLIQRLSFKSPSSIAVVSSTNKDDVQS